LTQPQATEEAKRLARKRWRDANPEHKHAYDRQWNRTKRSKESKRRRGKTAQHNRAFILAAKDRPCVDCGVQYDADEMHFDHVRGEKLFALGGNAARRSLAAIISEIAKCDVRCVWCHGRRHRQEQL
jgi:hypothetical protein